MGDSEVTSARYYQYGAAGSMNVDRLPLHRLPDDVVGQAGGRGALKPDYDPDSASTGTMWATGEKTIDERISQGPSSGDKSRQEPADGPRARAEAGKQTGNVSTAEITDATPAVLTRTSRCVDARARRTPATTCPTETKAAGGLGSIAEQTVDHKVDVVLGGGRGRFQQTVDGGPDDGKTVERTPRPRATPRSPTPTAWPPRSLGQAVLGLFNPAT